MTQAQHILTELESAGASGLTALEILDRTGSFRAAARIEELRKLGHNIETRNVKTASGKRIAQYVLHPSDQLFSAPPTAPSSAHYLEGDAA